MKIKFAKTMVSLPFHCFPGGIGFPCGAASIERNYNAISYKIKDKIYFAGKIFGRIFDALPALPRGPAPP